VFSQIIQLLSIEQDVNAPESSAVFKKYPKFLANHEAVDFYCDALRQLVNGIDAGAIDLSIETDMETHEKEIKQIPQVFSRIADALPGLGIVAAVLGIIITMGSIGGDTAEVGKHVAAALVGTFLGVLLCYGLVGPLARVVKFEMHHEITLLKVAKIGIVGLSLGSSPMIVCEAARRAIPENDRPEFKEMEDMLRQKASA